MLTKQTILEILDKPGLQAGINDYCYLLNNLYWINSDFYNKFYFMDKTWERL